MANKQGYGTRQSASVPAGDYRGYKRAIEQRRRNMNADDDSARYDNYADGQTYSENESEVQDDEVRAAAENAYAQSAGNRDDDLESIYDDDQYAQGDADEQDMPAPRRRARAYRSGQTAPRSYSRNADEPEAYDDAQAAEPKRPAREETRRQARRPVEQTHDDEEELADYHTDENSYSDDVYEPYDPDEDDSDYEPEGGSPTEWSDGIKRAFSKGRAGWKALKAKANAGGKKHPPQKKKRPPQQRAAAPVKREAPVAEEHEEYIEEEIQFTPQPAQAESFENESQPVQPAPRTRVDMSEYESVSAELHLAEEVKPVSRRERRMMQERKETPIDEFPNVNIVSRKAIRAQQQEAAAVEPQPAPEAPVYEPAEPEQPAVEEVQATVHIEDTQPEYEPEQPEEPVQPEQPAPVAYEPDYAPDVQPEQSAIEPEQGADDNSNMMFGVKGRQHVMQLTHDFDFDAQTDAWEAAGAEDQISDDDDQPDEQQPAHDESDDDFDDDELESEREHKRAHRERRQGRKNRNSRVASDDDDDEDDYRAHDDTMGGTAKYSRAAASQTIPMSDDDDEPEDDYVRAGGSSGGHGFIAPDNDFADEQFGDSSFEDEDDDFGGDDDDVHTSGGKGGGCLKAFTIFLVILLVLFGGVWALDYFGVINVRSIAGQVTSMSIFDPLRGNLLPAATAADDVQPTVTPEADNNNDAAATIQPAAQNTEAPAATDMPSVLQQDEQPTAEPVQAAALPISSAIQLNVDSPETYSQANTLRVELSQAAALKASQLIYIEAHPIDSASPDDSAFDLSYSVYENYKRADDYSREEPITFGLGEDYTDLEGVITFRGNNFRENAAYGTASLEQKKFKVLWKNNIGSIDSGYAVWTGVGWNGQPVMIHWSDEMRQMMNIRDSYKDDSDLVEVIYGTLDGNIYFLDSRTGDYTRDPIKLGFPIKGSVSIDPRGYPLLYVGQGISKANGKTGSIGWRVYNLLNQEHMYLLNGHDELRYRTHGSFDGVCLLDAETDTIVEGAENGIFYTIKLNTVFDKTAPSITIDPEVTLYRYKSRLSRAMGDDGLGIENSVAAYGKYAYVVDNSGLLTCMDLNTMKPAWLFDVGDDTDASISLEHQDDGTVALYTVNEVDIQGSSGLCTIRKLNALTGEQLWSYAVKCKSDGTNGGGGFASPAMGKEHLSNLIFFNVCRTEGGGTLYAFDKQTGEIVWQKSTNRYSWSSPVLVYNGKGDAVLIVGNSAGKLRMYDPQTGDIYDEIEISGNMEGSPAVYGDTLVIGTRDCKIYGIQIL